MSTLLIESHTVELNNVRLHYAEAPGPGPALVILHGLTGSHTEFLHLAPELAGQVHLYVLDLRGHGLSSRAEDGYRVADYGRDAAAFLDRVVGRPAVLVGHSLGALVAIWLAANAHPLLRGLFLSDPGFYIMQMPRFRQTVFYAYFIALRDHLHRYHASGASLERMIAYVGQAAAEEPGLPDPAVRERAIQLHQIDPAVLEPALAGTLLGAGRLDNLLAQVRCPIHLLAAQPALGGALEARDIPRAVAQAPHMTHAVIENASHDIHLDQPEAFVRELKRFLMKVGRDKL